MNSLRDLTVAWRCRAQCPLLAIARLPDGRTWHSLVGPGESTTHTTRNEWTMVTTERGMCGSNEQKIRPMKTWPRLSWTVSSHIQQKIHIARKKYPVCPRSIKPLFDIWQNCVPSFLLRSSSSVQTARSALQVQRIMIMGDVSLGILMRLAQSTYFLPLIRRERLWLHEF